MTVRHLVEILRTTAARHEDRPALYWKIGSSWHNHTYGQVIDQVDGVASGLIGLGVAEGDRVALFSQNRPEWALADFAVQSVRAVTVPIYATNTADQVAYILNQSGSRIVFAGDDSQRAVVESVASRCPNLETILRSGGER